MNLRQDFNQLYEEFRAQGLKTDEQMLATVYRMARAEFLELHGQEWDCAHHHGTRDDAKDIDERHEEYAKARKVSFEKFLIARKTNIYHFKLFLFGGKNEDSYPLCKLPKELNQVIFNLVKKI